LTLLETFTSNWLDRLKAPTVDKRSSHKHTGMFIDFDIFLAISLTDCADGPNEPSILIGFPIMIPPILFSSTITMTSFIILSVLILFRVLNGVAIDCLSSQIDTPILFDPKSKPINLVLFVCFFLNSSIVIILYILCLSDTLQIFKYHMTINLKTIKHISKLSRISVDDKKAKKLEGDLNSIFEFIEKLNELDTDKVEPLTSIAETTLKFRTDEVKSKDIRNQILKNSPEKNEDFFVVPKVVE